MSEVPSSPSLLRTNIARILTSLGKIDSAGEVADGLMEELRGTYDSTAHESILLEELEKVYASAEVTAIIQQMRDREQIQHLLTLVKEKASRIIESTEAHRRIPPDDKSPTKEHLPLPLKQVTRLIPRPQKI